MKIGEMGKSYEEMAKTEIKDSELRDAIETIGFIMIFIIFTYFLIKLLRLNLSLFESMLIFLCPMGGPIIVTFSALATRPLHRVQLTISHNMICFVSHPFHRPDFRIFWDDLREILVLKELYYKKNKIGYKVLFYSRGKTEILNLWAIPFHKKKIKAILENLKQFAEIKSITLIEDSQIKDLTEWGSIFEREEYLGEISKK